MFTKKSTKNAIKRQGEVEPSKLGKAKPRRARLINSSKTTKKASK